LTDSSLAGYHKPPQLPSKTLWWLFCLSLDVGNEVFKFKDMKLEYLRTLIRCYWLHYKLQTLTLTIPEWLSDGSDKTLKFHAFLSSLVMPTSVTIFNGFSSCSSLNEVIVIPCAQLTDIGVLCCA
jgi:hypothetical protein